MRVLNYDKKCNTSLTALTLLKDDLVNDALVNVL